MANLKYIYILVADMIIFGFTEEVIIITEGNESVPICINVTNNVEPRLMLTVRILQMNATQGRLPCKHHLLMPT